MGGFACYGLVDTYVASAAERYLPMSLSVDCRLKRDVPKDRPLRYDDVALPVGRVCDQLRAEQTAHFAGPAARAKAPA
jgi:predicted homoserine dehydrogenase-like protein